MLTPPRAKSDPQRALSDPPQTDALVTALDTMTIARPAAVQVLGLVDDPNATVPRLSSAIELDPALTAQIMRLANSAFYGMSGRVGNTSFAVAVIGFSAVRSLAAVNATGLNELDAAKPPGFWEHAASTAAACSALASIFGVPAGDAFAAGLLHDLGAALLHRFDAKKHSALVAEWGFDSAQLRDAEETTMGLGHDEAAARVLTRWSFPAPLVDAVRRHHMPTEGASPLTRMLVAGDHMANIVGGHRSDDTMIEVITSCGVPIEAVDGLLESIGAKAGEVLCSLSVD